MRIDGEPVIVRLARDLGVGLTAAPLDRPDPVEACHWYAVWHGDAYPE